MGERELETQATAEMTRAHPSVALSVDAAIEHSGESTVIATDRDSTVFGMPFKDSIAPHAVPVVASPISRTATGTSELLRRFAVILRKELDNSVSRAELVMDLLDDCERVLGTVPDDKRASPEFDLLVILQAGVAQYLDKVDMWAKPNPGLAEFLSRLAKLQPIVAEDAKGLVEVLSENDLYPFESLS